MPCTVSAASLNEGLPQKGKRFMLLGVVSRTIRASMKGFPRRGSDPSAQPVFRASPSSLNEGLPQKGKRCTTHRWDLSGAFPPQ